MADIKCVVCGESQRIMKRCCRCRETFYCSRECQRLNWKKHQPNCLHKTQQTMVNPDIKSDSRNKGLLDLQTPKNERPSSQSSMIKLKEKVCDGKMMGQDVKATNDLFVCSEQLPSSNRPVDQLKDFHIEQIGATQICVCIKYSKAKHKVQLTMPCTGMEPFKTFSTVINVPVENLKLIHKGKLQTEENIGINLKRDAVFLAFGEMAENEDGIDPRDIEIIMKQLSVDRNVAIKGLRKTNCLLDAIFEIGNGIL